MLLICTYQLPSGLSRPIKKPRFMEKYPAKLGVLIFKSEFLLSLNIALHELIFVRVGLLLDRIRFSSAPRTGVELEGLGEFPTPKLKVGDDPCIRPQIFLIVITVT